MPIIVTVSPPPMKQAAVRPNDLCGVSPRCNALSKSNSVNNFFHESRYRYARELVGVVRVVDKECRVIAYRNWSVVVNCTKMNGRLCGDDGGTVYDANPNAGTMKNLIVQLQLNEDGE